MNAIDIAKICHEANRAYCASLGDNSQLPWYEAPQWQRDSAMTGVKLHFDSKVSPGDSHKSWLDEKTRTGWKYGPVKDEVKKEHPCFVPFEELPQDQKIKDYLFCATASTLVECLGKIK